MEAKETTKKTIVIESQYLPSIQYWSVLQKSNEVILEKWEHYIKGTYRNRCYLAGPNGVQRLTVPVVKGKKQHTLAKDIRISYDIDWQRIHWVSLGSVYRSSPYFEYYEDDFEPIYNKKYKFLYDLNYDLLELIKKITETNTKLGHTKQFETVYQNGSLDMRSKILPQQKTIEGIRSYSPPVYHQVFQDRTGFLPNMSVVDLLFNTGPNIADHL